MNAKNLMQKIAVCLALGLAGLLPALAKPGAAFFQAPICFEKNTGQTHHDVKFLARGASCTLLLGATEAVLELRATDNTQPWVGGADHLRLRPVGANPNAIIAGCDAMPGKVNYFKGSSAERWQVGITTYSRVVYRDVYPGIDLVYYGNQRQFEQDFVVAPGANPESIRLAVDGAERIELDEAGDLVAHIGGNRLRLHKPIVYQTIDGIRQQVNGSYVLHDSDSSGAGSVVSFAVGSYNPDYPLVLDPVLSFATCLGGSNDDQAYGIALDSSGNVYVTGYTASTDFPTVSPLVAANKGGYDVFVAKFSPDGTNLVYATFIGGNDNDRGYNIAVDSAGNALVVGTTHSTNFPTANASQPGFGGGERDGFMLKLSPSGSELLYATYIGGNGNDDITCVALDESGNACVAGDTSSTDFPTANPLQPANRGIYEAVVAKFDANGAPVFSTYLGGSGPYDSAIGIAVDKTGSVYVAGYASSPDFPTTNAVQQKHAGGYDVFVTKLNPAGSALVYSTFLGGSGDDVGRSIAVDAVANAYISGDTFSTNYPIVKPFQAVNQGKRNAFVTKINPAGSQIVYSTYLGGSGEELASLTVDKAGCVHLAGLTSSTNFPTVSPLQAAFGGGQWDVFVAKFSQDGSKLVFSSFLGGSDVDQATPIAVDAKGDIYLAGATASTNFPTVKPLQAESNRGNYDAFVVKITGVEPGFEIVKVVPTPVKPAIVVTSPPPAEPITVPIPPVEEEAKPVETPVEPAPAPAPDEIKPAQPVPIPEIAPDTNIVEVAPEPKIKPEELPFDVELLNHPLFGTNLVMNGDAEAGSASQSSYSTVEIPNWTVTNNLTVLLYGTAGGFPSTNDPGPDLRGQQLFVGGPDNAASGASQSIDVSPIAAVTDSGQVKYTLSAWLGGVSGQRDNAVVELTFKDENDNELAKAAVGPVKLPERSYKTGLLERTVSGQLPTGARALCVRLQMNRVSGSYNDAFADNISLVLLPPEMPEPKNSSSTQSRKD